MWFLTCFGGRVLDLFISPDFHSNILMGQGVLSALISVLFMYRKTVQECNDTPVPGIRHLDAVSSKGLNFGRKLRPD